MSIDLAYQIKQLLKNEVIAEDILKNISSRNEPTDPTIIRDVKDGIIHKRIMQSSMNSENDTEYALTMNYNTDGAPLTKSGKRGLWPLQVNLNDLSFKLRFRFMLLTGLLIVTKEPKSNLLNLFIAKTLKNQIDEINSNGILLKR